MTIRDGDLAAAELSERWDALIEGRTPSPDDLLETILLLHETDDTPFPEPELQSQVWNELSGEVIAESPVSSIPSSNGHRRTSGRAQTASIARPAPANRWLGVAGVYRSIGVTVIAGLLAGFLAGVGARVVMRIAGVLTVDQNRGLLTENDAAVGVITVGGTIVLGLLGAAAGVAGAILYLAVRSALPWTGWRRGVVFGGALLAVFGFVVMDPSNPDYRLFGPAWLNVGTFSSIYLIFGALFVPLVERVDGRVPKLNTRSPGQIASAVVLLPFVVLSGIAILRLGISAMLDEERAPAILCWLVLIHPLIRDAVNRIPFDPAKQHLPAARHAVVALPAIAGLLLTVRAIADIIGV